MRRSWTLSTIIAVAAGGLLFGATDAPADRHTAPITINVPVALSRLDPSVTRIEVTCGLSRPGMYNLLARVFQTIDPATGAFSGTLTATSSAFNAADWQSYSCTLSLLRSGNSAPPVVGPGGGDNWNHVAPGGVTSVSGPLN